MRKLATIRRISAISPIPGADAVDLAFVLGWQVVVKKGDFQVGDLAVYFEIDSWLDESISAINVPVFQERFINWTDPEGKPRRGMRLKTIKLRKQISQGLILKIEDFSNLFRANCHEGDDVTEILRIEKWEPYEEVKGNSGGINKPAGQRSFPAFIRKTDQERVQNYINELGNHSEETFEVSIKLDGSSMTVFCVQKDSKHFAEILEDQEIRALRKKGFFAKLVHSVKKRFGLTPIPDFFEGVCSRNQQLGIDDSNHFSTYVRDNDVLGKIKRSLLSHENYAFQGELIAPSIQNNHEKVTGFEWYVFDIFDIDKQEYLLPQDVRTVCARADLKTVPILSEEENLASGEARAVVEGILAFAEGPGMNPGVKREGIVYKSNSTSFSFKAISDSYLLKKG